MNYKNLNQYQLLFVCLSDRNFITSIIYGHLSVLLQLNRFKLCCGPTK